MASRIVETLLRFKQDEQSAQRAIDRLDDIAAAETRVAISADDIRKNAALAGRELAGALSGRVAGGFDKLASGAEKAKVEIEQLRNEINQTEDSIDRARAAQERFDQISREVALAGDVQSNLGALSGLAGVAGAGGLAGGIGIAGELAALTEELPRLKAAVAGIPDVLSSAAGAIGIPGGAVGFLGAVAGVGVAFVAVNKIMGDAKKRADEAVAAQRRATAEALEAGALVARVTTEGTVEAAEAALDQINKRIDQVSTEINRLEPFEALAEGGSRVDRFFERIAQGFSNIDRQNLPRLLEDFGIAQEQLEEVFGAVENFNPADVRERLEALRAEGQGQVTARREVNDLIAEGTLLTEESAEALKREAEARQQLLTAAQQLIQTEVQQAQLLDQSTEALQDRLEAIEDERRGIERAIEFLRASGDTSEEVARQIADYEQTLQRLGETQEFINNQALQAARAREEQAQAEEDLEQAREEEAERLQRLANAQARYNNEIEAITERGLQARADLEQRYADRLVGIAEKAVEDSEKALADLEQTRREAALDLSRDIQDAEIERGRELLDNQIDLQRREVDLARDTARRIEDIRRQSAAREEDLLLQSDFAGLFQNRRQTSRDVESALTDQSRARDDLETTLQRQSQDQIRAFEQQRQDRLREYDRQLTDAQDQYSREAALIRENESKALALAETEYQKQTNALQDSLNEQLNARNSTYAQEIQMASQTAAQLTAIEAQKNAALIAQAQASLSAINRLGSQVFANVNNTTNNVNRVGVGGNLVVQSTGSVRDVQRAIVSTLDRLLP